LPPPAITNADVALAEASFQAQWAFTSTVSPGTVGIGLVNAGPGLPKPTNHGAGVRVGIFDTSPVIRPGLNVTWTTQPWSFQIFTPTVTATLSGYTVTLPHNSPDLKDHGLFSAGLVHAVASDSSIHLYRVLDDYAQGNVWVLNAALVDFMTDALGSAKELRGAVLNISLGLRPEKGSLPGLPDEVQSLKYLVTAAYCQGMVVVAAAGNESAKNTANNAPPEPRAMPALFSPAAIAVARSNRAGQRACYSNDGDITAPGGETKGGCSGTYDEFSLVGPVMMSGRFPWGYAYWAGSSFATPLVSGLAALGAGAWPPGRWATQGQQLPDDVRSGINGSAVHPLSADPNRTPPGGISRVP
jgi:subtilisin family serine protease